MVKKINWTKLFKNNETKNIIKSFASRDIAFEEMIYSLKNNKHAIDEINLIVSLGEPIVRNRILNALNKSGTPISGFKQYVDFWPIP